MSTAPSDTVAALTTRATLPRVNLLPPEVHDARKLRQLQMGLGAAVAAVVVVLVGAFLVQAQGVNGANDGLAASKARSATLSAQKQQYAQVPATLNAIDAAALARQTAMSQDVQWYRYLNDLTYITPANAWLTDVSIALNSAGSSTNNPLDNGGIATVTATGLAKHHVDVASWLDAVAKEPGWTSAYFTQSDKTLVEQTVVVQFNSTISVTDAALSHRYDRKAG